MWQQSFSQRDRVNSSIQAAHVQFGCSHWNKWLSSIRAVGPIMVVQSDSLLITSEILSNGDVFTHSKDDAVMEIDIKQSLYQHLNRACPPGDNLSGRHRRRQLIIKASTRPTHPLRKKPQQSIQDDCLVLDSSDDGSSIK